MNINVNVSSFTTTNLVYNTVILSFNEKKRKEIKLECQ